MRHFGWLQGAKESGLRAVQEVQAAPTEARFRRHWPHRHLARDLGRLDGPGGARS
jgi:hypothetical protein